MSSNHPPIKEEGERRKEQGKRNKVKGERGLAWIQPISQLPDLSVGEYVKY